MRDQPHRPAPIRFAAVCLVIGAAAVPDARAADWSMSGRVIHRYEADSNSGLESTNPQSIFSTSLGVGLLLRGETSRGGVAFDFSGNGIYYVGEDDSLDGTGRIDPRIEITGRYRGKTYTADGRLLFSEDPATLTETVGASTAERTSTQYTYSASGSLAFNLDRVNTLTFGASGEFIDFSTTSDDLVPNRTFGLTTTWARRLTETTTAEAIGGGRLFIAEGGDNTVSRALDATLGLSYRPTARHTVGARAGITGVWTEDDVRGSVFDVGFTGSLTFGYTLADTSFTFEIGHGIEPGYQGQLDSATRASAGMTYNVNSRQVFSLGVEASHRDPISGSSGAATSLFTVSPTYTWALSRDAGLSVGYIFRLGDDEDTGTAVGHQAMVTFRYDFELFP